MTQVYLSLGSNIDRKKHLHFGLNELEAQFGTLSCSQIYETQAVGFTGDPFYNMVVGVTTSQTLSSFQDTLKQIEKNAGRKPNEVKFSARTLDIDILLFGDKDYHPEFDIPRQEIIKYNFVLQPLAEIAPTLLHPVLNKNMQSLWQDLMSEKKLTSIVTF